MGALCSEHNAHGQRWIEVQGAPPALGDRPDLTFVGQLIPEGLDSSSMMLSFSLNGFGSQTD